MRLTFSISCISQLDQPFCVQRLQRVIFFLQSANGWGCSIYENFKEGKFIYIRSARQKEEEYNKRKEIFLFVRTNECDSFRSNRSNSICIFLSLRFKVYLNGDFLRKNNGSIFKNVAVLSVFAQQAFFCRA